jgi:PAS domain S-box-containing protein
MSDSVSFRTESLVDDAEQILEAIRSGCVDAFVVEEHEGRTVYALQSADLPYNALVQKMHQGAAMLNPAHEVIYCNPGLATLLDLGTELPVGRPLQDFIHPDNHTAFRQMLEAAQSAPAEGELVLRRTDGSVVPVKVSVSTLSGDKSIIGILVADLSAEKANAELAARIQSVQDEERRGIARELHDSVGQLLAAIGMNLNRFRKESPTSNSLLMPLIEDSAVMVEQVSKEIRTISHLLHPPLLDVAGLSAAIRWYIDGFSERSGIHVEVDIPSDCGRLSSEAEIAIFRVVQECLTNVYRHSGSKRCSIAMRKEPGRLRVEIRDAGRGMPSRKKGNGKHSSGLGLRGMQERLRQFGGTLEVNSTEQGTVVVATLPLSVTPPGQQEKTA